MEEIQEQLEKRDMILRYFKQVDYNLKPSKDIYTRIKSKIIGLSGINAKPDRPYAELCKQAGLELKEGKELITSLYNKELIHMIKKYDSVLINQEVEAYYIEKQYTSGMVIPDIAMINRKQAIDYIINVINMNIMLKTLNNLDINVFRDAANEISISDNDRAQLHNVLNYRNKTQVFPWLRGCEKEMLKANPGLKIDLVRDVLMYLINNVKKIDLLQNLLSDAVKKNPNVNQKFYAGSCEVNDIRYYLFPI